MCLTDRLLVQGWWILSMICPSMAGLHWESYFLSFILSLSLHAWHQNSSDNYLFWVVSSWSAQSIYTAVDKAMFPSYVNHATILTADWCVEIMSTLHTALLWKWGQQKLGFFFFFFFDVGSTGSIIFDKWRAFLKQTRYNFFCISKAW